MIKIQSCTGCSACISICPQNCIKLILDENGFSQPQLEILNCMDCGLCEEICPVLNKLELAEEQPKAFAAWSCDSEIRANSSSGGIFSELVKEVLAQGGAVLGAAYDENFVVKHICIETEEELLKLRGAKYAQSDLGNSFIEIRNRLKNKQKVLGVKK